MVVHPIAGDNNKTTQRFIEHTHERDFASIERLLTREGERYGVALKQPVMVKLGATLEEAPPQAPAGSNVLRIMWWSLHMRYWAWQVAREHPTPTADIHMFVVYPDPNTVGENLNSFGL